MHLFEIEIFLSHYKCIYSNLREKKSLTDPQKINCLNIFDQIALYNMTALIFKDGGE